MKISKILKLTRLLAVAGILSFKYKKKTYEESYVAAQKYSLRVIKQLGYQLVMTRLENLPEQGPLLFFSNHQGTLDPTVWWGLVRCR